MDVSDTKRNAIPRTTTAGTRIGETSHGVHQETPEDREQAEALEATGGPGSCCCIGHSKRENSPSQHRSRAGLPRRMVWVPCARKGSVRTTPRQTSGLNMRQKGARTRQDAHGRVRRCRRVSTRRTCLRHAAESYGTVKTIRGFIVEERQHIVWGGSKTMHRLFGSLIRPCLSRLNIGGYSRWSCLARHGDDPRGKNSGWSCLARHKDDPSRMTRGGMPCAPPRRSQKRKRNLDPRPS